MRYLVVALIMFMSLYAYPCRNKYRLSNDAIKIELEALKILEEKRKQQPILLQKG